MKFRLSNARKIRYCDIDPELQKLDLMFSGVVIIDVYSWTPNEEIEEELHDHGNPEQKESSNEAIVDESLHATDFHIDSSYCERPLSLGPRDVKKKKKVVLDFYEIKSPI